MPTIKYKIYRRLTFTFRCTHCDKIIETTSECESLYSYLRHYYKVLRAADKHAKMHKEVVKDKFIDKMKWVICSAVDSWLM